MSPWFHVLDGVGSNGFVRCGHVSFGALTWVVMVSDLTELGEKLLVGDLAGAVSAQFIRCGHVLVGKVM